MYFKIKTKYKIAPLKCVLTSLDLTIMGKRIERQRHDWKKFRKSIHDDYKSIKIYTVICYQCCFCIDRKIHILDSLNALYLLQSNHEIEPLFFVIQVIHKSFVSYSI